MIRQKNIFKSQWTPQRIKELRKKFGLTQSNLALIVGAPQQRINDWENGHHSMKRPYSLIFDQAEEAMQDLHILTNGVRKNFCNRMQKLYNVELNKELKDGA